MTTGITKLINIAMCLVLQVDKAATDPKLLSGSKRERENVDDDDQNCSITL